MTRLQNITYVVAAAGMALVGCSQPVRKEGGLLREYLEVTTQEVKRLGRMRLGWI